MQKAEQARWETIKTLWWTSFALAVFGNTLVAFFGATDLLKAYRYVAGALFVAATLVLVVAWIRRRRGHR